MFNEFLKAPVFAATSLVRHPFGFVGSFLVPVLLMLVTGLFAVNMYDRLVLDSAESFVMLALTGAWWLGVVFVMGFFAAWAAVSWHRVVLLEHERPKVRFGLRLRYFGFVLLIGLIAAAAIQFPGSMLFGYLPFEMRENTTIYIVWFVVLGLVLNMVWMALGLVLPGMAIGKPMKLGTAFETAKRHPVYLFGAAATYVAVQELAFSFITPDSFLPSTYLLEFFVIYIPLAVIGIVLQTALYHCYFPAPRNA